MKGIRMRPIWLASIGLLALAPAGAARMKPRFAWPAGLEVRYHVEWKGQTRANVQGTSFDGSVDLAGDLILHSYGTRSDHTVIGVRLVDVRRATLTAAGQTMFPDLDAATHVLEGVEGQLETDERGRYYGVHFPKGAHPLLVQVLSGVVAETQVTLPESTSRTWTATEAGNQARVEQRYEIVDDAKHIHRTSGRIDALTLADDQFLAGAASRYAATSDIVLDPNGHVASLRTDATVRAEGDRPVRNLEGTTTFTLEQTSVQTIPQLHAPIADGETRVPGQLPSTSVEDEIEQQVAGDLTVDSVLATIDDYEHGVAPVPVWIAQAASFVRLHPEVTAALAEQFHHVRPSTKQLVFDVLSAGGSTEAQSQMRDLIESEEVAADRLLRVRLLARFSFVQEPDAATLDYLAGAYDAARAANDRPMAHATVYPLGAVIGHYEDAFVANTALARLISDLTQSSAADDRVALLAALGNASMGAGYEAVLRYKNDSEREVRAQVALSLRGFDVPQGRAALVDMLTDADTQIAQTALSSLRKMELPGADVSRVAELVEQGDISTALQPTLISFAMERRGSQSASAARILRTIAARAERPEIASLARSSLAEIE